MSKLRHLVSGTKCPATWTLALRLIATGVVMRRLASAARARPPLTANAPEASLPTISVIVPARDEADRIVPLLEMLRGAPGVVEVIVVDDESTDMTAELARRRGAHVIGGRQRPPGWAGKPWALQQGVEAATGDWIVSLDADTRPDPQLPSSAVTRAMADGTDLLTLAGRFECPTAPSRWLHAAMLTTLVYRFGAPGSRSTPRRQMANGQCMVFERERFVALGGFEPVAAHIVEDVALARRHAAAGRRVDFLDASELLTVRMYESLPDTWRGWGRSIGLSGVESGLRQLIDVVALAVTLALPLPRLLTRRGDALDVALMLTRLGTLVGTRRAYLRNDTAYWSSPLADAPAVVAVALSALRRRRTWRGRTYA